MEYLPDSVRLKMRVGVAVCAVAHVASTWAAASTPDCSGVNGLRPQCKPVEALHHREVFHVGGHYDEKSVLVDKMYVEKLTPSKKVSKPYPLVFFHGGGYSGAVSAKRRISVENHTMLTELLSIGLAANPR